MKHRIIQLGLLLAVLLPVTAVADTAELERGRYLLKISGCNDCHTANYAQQGGLVPEDDWLTGVPVGFQGPWGTTYPANLRLLLNSMDETQWLNYARIERRPPMPWFALRDMTDEDLRAIYQFVISLGPKGEPTPLYAPPEFAVTTPVIDFMPKQLPQ
ncbi:MAG: cytochrome C [Candidatus Competibacteraceae bacterium]|nr:cytochrome C [Candidatus Competibacteraceae bacterium]